MRHFTSRMCVYVCVGVVVFHPILMFFWLREWLSVFCLFMCEWILTVLLYAHFFLSYEMYEIVLFLVVVLCWNASHLVWAIRIERICYKNHSHSILPRKPHFYLRIIMVLTLEIAGFCSHIYFVQNLICVFFLWYKFWNFDEFQIYFLPLIRLLKSEFPF